MGRNTENPYYRSLDEKQSMEAFKKECVQEFSEPLPLGPEGAGKSEGIWTRREFLKAMGFSTAAVMAASCKPMPIEKAIPYLVAPENIVPGRATWFSSTCGGCEARCGLIVKTREGRPIKVEGNPDSPLNRGGLCAVGHAGVLDLYDSGRLHGPRVDGVACDWSSVDARVAKILGGNNGEKLRVRILSRTVNSPTLLDVIQRFRKKYPLTQHLMYDAVSMSGMLDAHEIAFGKRLLPHLKFNQADLIVSLNADFLGTWLSPVEFAKDYQKRRSIDENPRMSRHVQLESRLSLTGSNADERILMKPSEEMSVALALLGGVTGRKNSGSTLDAKWASSIRTLVGDLLNHRGRSLVVSGSNHQKIQLAVLALNDALGNYGSTFDITSPCLQKQGSDRAVKKLQAEMEAGEVDVLIVAGCNPVYELPDGMQFAVALKKVKMVISASGRLDETAALAHVNAPDHHFLESWEDSEPVSGVFHFSQPSIAPVYATRQWGESLLVWSGGSENFEAAVRNFWSKKFTSGNGYRKALQQGVYVERKADRRMAFKVNPRVYEILADTKDDSLGSTNDFELEVFESVMMRDGRAANNPWLQETPDPITKMTWGNAVQMAVADGKRLGLSQGNVVALQIGKAVVELPVVLQPGQMQGTLAVPLGYGRLHAGRVGNQVGENVVLCTSYQDDERLFWQRTQVSKTSRTETLALTQIHYSLENRPLVKEMNVADLTTGSQEMDGGEKSVMLWKEHESKDHAWGLAIDLNACIGCSGCLVSCQAENNVAVVGKEEVHRQREMHWIRIDRYYKGEVENPDVVFEPMLCQHCGNAPCESVCPVLATVHSSDGLNQQVYNRCVGTRYCANNCPYKVRRFNWFDYANNKRFDFHMNDATGKLVLNPDVTVRTRGVMEKCSLCVQRIQEEKIKAKAAGKKLNTDDIKTACQQSCPTEAIVFGDRNDPNGKLAKMLEKNVRTFKVLEELNVKPAITYLAKVRNRGT